MAYRPTILVVDDEENMRESLKDILEEDNYSVEMAENGVAALEAIESQEISVVITDARMPEMDGFELLRKTKHAKPDLPVIMITAYATPKLAVEAMKQGAEDYVSKPFDPDEILIKIKSILRHNKLLAENIRLKGTLKKGFDISNIIGESAEINEVLDLIGKVAPAPSYVLIQGESGTGKELVAKAIHTQSPRRDEPFITVNCAAIPETLLESELFGYRKGAFTDAHKDKKGRFEEADGGTLFLDEIGDMAMALQAKILRVLQEKTFRKIGDEQTTEADVRVIAATNKDLIEAIKEGSFREDLYFRINVINISLPPLRNRKSDIPLLIRHFIQRYNLSMGKQVNRVTEDAVNFMKNYAWPGNIRELENLVERLIILCPEDYIDLDHVKKNMLMLGDSPKGIDGFIEQYPDFKEAVDAFQRLVIERALDKAGGHTQRAADLLKISRPALRYQMKKLGIAGSDEI